MSSAETRINELGYHIANLCLLHKHLLGFMTEDNKEAVNSFKEQQLPDMRQRCLRVRELLTEIACNHPSQFISIVGPGTRSFIDHSLNVSYLMTIGSSQKLEEAMVLIQYRNFIETITKIGRNLPQKAYSMFDTETQKWIQGQFEFWLSKK